MVDTQHTPVFSAGGRVFTWADVVSAARARGDWAELQQGLGRLLACEHELARADALPSAAEIRSAAAEFRHRRNLLSADELTQWLHGNDVTVAEWTGEMRRTLLAPSDDVDVAAPIDEVSLERASWVHAVCSGGLGGYAWRLAEEVAVLLSTGASLDEDLADLAAGRERFCQVQANEAALAAEVNNNKMNWVRIDLRRLIHAEEMVVREAALCVRLDGRPLAEVAGDAGARLEDTSQILDDIEPTLRPRLLAVGNGELLGPLRVGDQYQLVLVAQRVPPSVADPAIRARATSMVVQRALSAELSRHVIWHWRERA